jgi:hypothetical protein
VDFGVMHLSLAWVVHGRPGARGEKHVQHVSCAGSVDFIPSDGCFTIGADGTFSGPLSNPVITDCSLAEFGQWQSYVIVDGQRSNTSSIVYFDHMCPVLATCSIASTYCPAASIGPGLPSCP